MLQEVKIEKRNMIQIFFFSKQKINFQLPEKRVNLFTQQDNPITVEKDFFYSKFDYKNKESKKLHKQQQQQ